MRRMTFAILLMVVLFAATKPSEAADLTSTFGLEEAFIDTVGNCGPSSSTAGALGETSDPAVQIALRNAEIIEAADAAAGVTGSSKALQDCMQKFLIGRGYNKSQMTVLQECAKQDWRLLRLRAWVNVCTPAERWSSCRTPRGLHSEQFEA
jgi:hypothetical protein